MGRLSVDRVRADRMRTDRVRAERGLTGRAPFGRLAVAAGGHGDDGRLGARQTLTALAMGLHERMRQCDGEVCLEVILLLADGERNVGALARLLLLDMPTVSGRLAAMREAGLVRVARRDGLKRYYALAARVRVSVRKGKRVIRIRASGGGELRIVVPEEVMARIGEGWRESGGG